MSGLDFLENMNEIEERFVRESVPGKKARRTKLRLSLLAASLILLALALGIGIPLLKKDPAKEETGQVAVEGDPDVLYEDDSTKVTRITEHSPKTTDVEALLTYYSERELFEKCSVLIRGKVLDKTNIAILSKKTGWITDASLLTIEPIRVIRGELTTEGPVRVFVNRYLGTSLGDLTLSLKNASIGEEGLLLLSDIPTYNNAIKELADYRAFDSQRFAIWSNGRNLLFDTMSFPGIQRLWTLDEAEAYIRSVLENNEPAPEDFTFFIRFKSYEYYAQGGDLCRSFNSADGVFSYEGDAEREAALGTENLTTVLKLKKEELDEIYRSIKRLYELPDEIAPLGKMNGSYQEEIEISFTANGVQKRVFYSGYSNYEDADFRRLWQTEDEIHRTLMNNEDRIAWENQLNRLERKRSSENTEKTDQ